MKKLICLLLAVTMAACAGEYNKSEGTMETDVTAATYEEAVSAYNAGAYEEAFEKLAILGNYKDAAQLLATIHAEKTGMMMETTTSEGVSTSNVTYSFQNGNLVNETVTHDDGTVTKNHYNNNDIGLCTSQTLSEANGEQTVIHNFYKDGTMIRTGRTNPDKSKDVCVYTYDDQGKILSHKLTLADGTVEEAVYNYDEATGHLLSIVTRDSANVFAYNQYGDVSNETLTANGEEVYKISYSYDYNFSVN